MMETSYEKKIYIFALCICQIATANSKRKKDDVNMDCLDFTKKILHTAWHPTENVIAVAATNNLYLFQDRY